MESVGSIFIICLILYFTIKLAVKSAINEAGLCNKQSSSNKRKE